MDAHACTLREHEQLGVEEPRLVLHLREQAAGDVRLQRLEPALRVREPGAEAGPDEQVVAARKDLPLHPAAHMGGMRQPGSDRDLGVTGEKRRDEREEARKIRGQVDVHVRDDVGSTGQPGGAQREPASLAVEPEEAHLRLLGRKAGADCRRAVGAGVVGDDDREPERVLAPEVVDQQTDVLLEHRLLVVDGDDDLDELSGGIHGPKSRERD